MPPKRNNEDKPKRLAKSVSQARRNKGLGRARKGAVRAVRGGHAGRALADEYRTLQAIGGLGQRTCGKAQVGKIGACRKSISMKTVNRKSQVADGCPTWI